MAITDIAKDLKKLEDDVQTVIKSTLLKYMQMIMDEGLRGLPPPVASTYHLVVSEGGYSILIYTDSDLAAWMEFGTGTAETVQGGLSAAEYLATQPEEVSKEASKFFITGRGSIPAQPTFFPAYLRLRVVMVDEMRSKINKLAKDF